MLNRRALMGAIGATMSFLLSGFARKAGAEQTPQVRVDVSVCFDSGTLLWVPFRASGLPEGLWLRPLRRLDDGSLRSAVVRIPAGWASGGDLRLAARLQLYVLSGELTFGARRLGPNAYLNYAADSVMPVFGTDDGAEFLLVCDGPPAFSSIQGPAVDDGIIIENAAAGFQVRTTDVVPSGIKGRNLWEDKATGATMALLQVPPGWESPGPEYHPCNEEIFCVSGDIAPDDIRILQAGWFLWNPAYGVHGFHLHSTAGGIVLEWHDAAWAKHIYQAEPTTV